MEITESENAAIELGLKLFEHSVKQNIELANSILESKNKQIRELQEENNTLNFYMYYTQDCIKLYCVPLTFNKWYDMIYTNENYLS